MSSNLSMLTTSAIGDTKKGQSFNTDQSDTGGFPFDFNLDFKNGPIEEIDIYYPSSGNVISGITIWYQKPNGRSDDYVPAKYGDTTAANKAPPFKLQKDEVIVHVMGLHGTNNGDVGIVQLTFVKLLRGGNGAIPTLTTSQTYGPPIGTQSTLKPFYVCGPLVAIPADGDASTKSLLSMSFVTAKSPIDGQKL